MASLPLPQKGEEDKKNHIKTHLHHILPSLSISIVVGSIIQISVLLHQVNACCVSATFLTGLAVCSNHVDDAKEGGNSKN